jgi:hypothetical protein
MTPYADSCGKLFAGKLPEIAKRMAMASVKLAYVHLAAQDNEMPISPLTLNHAAFASHEDRFRRRRVFANFLGDNEAALRLVHSLLRDSGILCLRVNAYLAAYARLLVDEIFGDDSFVNDIPLRSPEAAMRSGTFAPGPAQDDALLVFARDAAQFQWYAGNLRGASRMQIADVVDHTTKLGDLVLTVDESHPVRGVTARALAERRRVVAVSSDLGLIQHLYASYGESEDFPLWMGTSGSDDLQESD